jgi:hypothetical protein
VADDDVAAQLANIPDAVSVTDMPRDSGRSSGAADTVLDPGLTVPGDPIETAPIRSSSRSRRARQRTTAAAVVASSTVDLDTATDADNGRGARGAVDDDMRTEAVPVTDRDAGLEDAATEVEIDAATDVTIEDVAVEDVAIEDVATDAAVTEVLPATEDAVDDAPVTEDEVDDDADDEALLDTEAVAVVESDSAMPTEVLPVIEDRSAPQSLVETEILPELEPRIYDVETDEPGAYVSLVPAVTEPAALPAHVEDEPEAPVVVRRRRRRPRVRRVTRVIRHVDTWTVFKVVLLFNIVLYAATLISGVLLWNVAHGTGTVGNVERFMESFGWETFEFNGQEIFDNGWRLGMFVALGLTGLAVLAATTFNLITDIVGGIRVTVLEEEVVVAAPEMPRRKSTDPPTEP